MPFKPDSPKPRTYKAVFVENEYLKLTYLPELGGRFFALYDKVRNREVFYRNDVIKGTGFNSKLSWPQTGIELTGAYDTHMLTLYGEPYWSHRVVRNDDGSVSLVLGSIEPVYHMKVDLTATLYPGLEAMRMSVFCFNRRDARMPQMFWISGALRATEKTRFIYPMTRTIGHTTSEVADWPTYNGLDYSWDQNNKHMLGVFGIDIYDNFQGAYDFGSDYGVFRYADRRMVTGMKMWTFGYSPTATNLEHAYTDGAGPYIEVQSGRHVWDGHYEYVGPHKFEHWYEWWLPVSGIGGLTTTSRDVALNLEVKPDAKGQSSEVKIGLSANRAMPGARVTVKAKSGELLNTTADLSPAKPFNRTLTGLKVDAAGLTEMTVRVADASGQEVLSYLRPDTNPGRKEYTPYTAPLEKPAKDPDQMSAEELAMAADFKFKELKDTAAVDLLNKALVRDPGYSKAHLLLGIHHFVNGRYQEAAAQLNQVIERDPYQDEAYYYLAQAQLRIGQEKQAERNLYYIAPLSGYWANREYVLGRLEFLRGAYAKAAEHLEEAVRVNGYELDGRLMLALLDRDGGNKARALERLAEVEKLDPTSAWAAAERYFLTRDEKTKAGLADLMGGQSQEALDVSMFYRDLKRWNEAVEVLQLVEANNHDVWGTPAEFYYTLAYCLNRKGETGKSAEYLKKAQAAAANVDRFPYREESGPVFTEAIERNAKDAVARFNLACLLYHEGRPAEAIKQWEAAVEANPRDFGSRRALGLAYAEQGGQVEKAAAQLEKAIEINPAHV
jgi:tetratricopeptide (TPR) repeat protein